MRNEQIATVLKEYRRKNQFTVQDVSFLLHERSFDVAPKTIYGWESGQSSPSADILLTLCEMYHITDVLSAFGYTDVEEFHLTSCERVLIDAYRRHPELHPAIHKLLDLQPVRKLVPRSKNLQETNSDTENKN